MLHTSEQMGAPEFLRRAENNMPRAPVYTVYVSLLVAPLEHTFPWGRG